MSRIISIILLLLAEVVIGRNGYWPKWLLDEVAIGRSGHGRNGNGRNGFGRNDDRAIYSSVGIFADNLI